MKMRPCWGLIQLFGSQQFGSEIIALLNATMDPVLLFGITTKKTSPLQLCQRRQVYAGKKSLRWHRYINAFFGLKTVVNQKSVNLGMISARHTSNRQSFKKVTCPFNKERVLTCFFFIQAPRKKRLSLRQYISQNSTERLE